MKMLVVFMIIVLMTGCAFFSSAPAENQLKPPIVAPTTTPVAQPKAVATGDNNACPDFMLGRDDYAVVRAQMQRCAKQRGE